MHLPLKMCLANISTSQEQKRLQEDRVRKEKEIEEAEAPVCGCLAQIPKGPVSIRVFVHVHDSVVEPLTYCQITYIYRGDIA